ncbi:hypothetical protein GM545_14435 [Streptococcus pneumoniae]|uniref:DNA mismatch repair protein MutS clamp domain-containing protein n=1 Tax=Streptococcus pneumoniae TaxID=1313 RepID=A0A7X2XMG3_STREE|nr:hypothetical protein [Streptococcus pneumoniae]
MKVGAENSITGAEISLITKLAERTVQDIISRLIMRYGIPIIGVRHGTFRGYFIQLTKRSYWTVQKHFTIRYEKKKSA